MSSRSLVVGSFVVTLLVVGSAWGQGMPDLERKWVDRLVGTWKCVDRSGDTVVEGKIVCEWKGDKAVLVWNWKGPLISTPESSMTSSGMFGWDGKDKVLREYCFASTGEKFSATHKITEESWESPAEGTLLIDGKFQVETSLRIIKFKSDDEFEVIATQRLLDGKEQPDIVGTYTRIQ